MDVEITTIQLSLEQANFLALCQKNYKKIKYHIENGLWEKKGGSYTVNLKDDGSIQNCVESIYHIGY